MDRAKRRADSDAADEKKQREETQRRAEAANRANNLYDVAREALQNPTSLLGKAFNRNSSLYSELFDRNGKIKNPSLAEELYRYAWNQAHAGIDAQRGITNPLIQSIQKNSLKELQKVWDDAFRQWDNASRQLDRILADTNSTRSVGSRGNLAPSNPPSNRSSNSRGSEDCKILDNPERSRDLMAQDQARWLELSQRCTK